MEELSDRLHHNFVQKMLGREADVLFESTMRGDMMYGYTGNYVRVKAPYDRSLINKISHVKLISIDENDDVIAEIIR